jgi:hypothetical protein
LLIFAWSRFGDGHARRIGTRDCLAFDPYQHDRREPAIRPYGYT